MDTDVFIFNTNNEGYNSFDANMGEFKEWFVELVNKTVTPGNRVVIKPNLVKECQITKRELWEHVITNPKIIKFVLEIVVSALKNEGEIRIVESPEAYSDFQEILKRTKLNEIIQNIQETTNVKIFCYDLRYERWIADSGIILDRVPLVGDPLGQVEVDFRDKSEFYGKINNNYYGADFDTAETAKYHNRVNNRYVVAKSVLDCDVYINLPKLKTHKLAGITASMKNLVGICVNKNCIPHHTVGNPETGGDQFPSSSEKNRLEMMLTTIARRILKYNHPIITYPSILFRNVAFSIFGSSNNTIRNGAWYGNDTIWRSIIDLNRLIFYSDLNGVLHHSQQRKYITLIDGIVGSEGNGPMDGDPITSHVLLAATNPVYADTVMATIMGFNYHKIPYLEHSYYTHEYPLIRHLANDICIKSNVNSWEKRISDFKYDDTLKFKPHFGWINHIEIKK